MMIFARAERWLVRCARFAAVLCLAGWLPSGLLGQAAPGANSAQELVFAGLRSVAAQGQFRAVKSDSAGNLYLLLNQGDGVRLLKTDGAGSAVLAEAQLGAAGDVGVGLALDPSGNVYVTGTSSSGSLQATAGAAFRVPSGAGVTSFVARFDPALRPVFVTFTGGSRISAAGVAATADAVFVTGITYATDLPVTPNGVQQAPAPGSAQSGFVERFSSDGSTLVYATYLTGANGSTTPTAIAADASDDAFIAGSTTASGFPTVAALVPEIIGNPSGFLTKLNPAGDGYSFSTFVPGAGLTSIAVDLAGQTLLASGTVALGQFPVDTVAMPLVPASYQVLLKLPLDGSKVLSSVLIAPGTESFVASAAADGSVWVDGTLAAPLFAAAPLATTGTGFAVRVDPLNRIDQTARFGGIAGSNPSFASLPTKLLGIAVDPAGEPILAGSVEPTASATLLPFETYDLPLRNAPSAALPTSLAEAKLPQGSCNGSLCAGSAAYLARLNPAGAAPALSFSVDDAPHLTLRNLGSSAATGLTLTASGPAIVGKTCGSVLAAGAECNILLDPNAGAAGIITADAGNSAPQAALFPAYPAQASSIVFTPRELDFGIESGADAPTRRTITVSNLGSTSQTFTSTLDSTARTTPAFTQSASDCPLGAGAATFLLNPNQSCHITLAFSASAAANLGGDGFLEANWLIAGQNIVLTAGSQAAELGTSSAEIDFGTQIAGGLRLPRYLYLSNHSSSSVAHAPLALPAGSAFTVTDQCPSTLQPHSVCRIRIDYLAAQQTSTDSTTLTLDQGLSVPVTGRTLPPAFISGLSANPNLSVNPANVTFPGATVVTGVSSSTETVTVSNHGLAAFSLSLGITGDFSPSGSCGASLPGGSSCQVVLSFTPSQPGTRQGLLSVIGGSGTSPVTVALSGNASEVIPVANGSIDFGSVVVGTPVVRFFKVAQAFSNLLVSASGPYRVALVEDVGFGPGQPPASSFVASVSAPCHTCLVGVLFQPAASGAQPGVLTISSAAGGLPSNVDLTGTGIAATGLVLTPAIEQFGTVPQNSVSAPAFFTLTNLSSDQSVVTVGSPVVTGDFRLSSAVSAATPCGGPLPYTASCEVAVAFTPGATGTRSGLLTLPLSGSSNVGTSVQAVLSGTGGADPGIALDPTALVFSNVPGLSATQQIVTITNTGGGTVQVGQPATSTVAFTSSTNCSALLLGASCTVAVTFHPGAAQATDTLLIPATMGLGGNTQTASYAVPLTGSYTAANAGLAIVPGQAVYGPQATLSEGSARQFTVSNLTGQAVSLDAIVPRQYALLGPPCVSLGPNASCSFEVEFVPLTGGDATGSLVAQAAAGGGGSASASAISYLDGYGIGHGSLVLSGGLIANDVFNFNQVASGQTSTQVFTLTNASAAATPPITVRRVSSQPPFLSQVNCATPLAPGESCTVALTYAPVNQVATGSTSPAMQPNSGILTIESDAASSPNVLNLAGSAAPVAVPAPSNSAPLATYSLSQSSLTFAATQVGDVSAPQVVTILNTGNVPLTFSSLLLPPDFTVLNTCTIVVPGQSCTLTVASTPETAGTHIAALELVSNAATSLEYISLLSTSTPSSLLLSPQTLSFGSVLVGQTSTLAIQATNTSANPIRFTSVSASGDFKAGGDCPPSGAALAANTSCTLQVVFGPTATGTRQGTLYVASSASTLPLVANLSGTGVQPRLVVTPSALAFGSVVIGIASNQTVTLANLGSAPVSGLLMAASGDYAVSIPCALTTLAPGQSCSAQITFRPSGLGERDGAVTVTNTAQSSPLTVPVTGTGIQNGGFILTVDGGSAASVSVRSGQPATYNLTVTPTLGFEGAVALTCTAVAPAVYASCAISPSGMTLVSSPQNSTATLNTLGAVAGNALLRGLPPLPADARSFGSFLCLLLPGAFGVWRLRRPLRGRLPVLLALVITACTLVAIGCGSGSNPNLRYAPAGTYQYVVTASSTSGVQTTQTVTLNLTVTPR